MSVSTLGIASSIYSSLLLDLFYSIISKSLIVRGSSFALILKLTLSNVLL